MQRKQLPSHARERKLRNKRPQTLNLQLSMPREKQSKQKFKWSLKHLRAQKESWKRNRPDRLNNKDLMKRERNKTRNKLV